MVRWGETFGPSLHLDHIMVHKARRRHRTTTTQGTTAFRSTMWWVMYSFQVGGLQVMLATSPCLTMASITWAVCFANYICRV